MAKIIQNHRISKELSYENEKIIVRNRQGLLAVLPSYYADCLLVCRNFYLLLNLSDFLRVCFGIPSGMPLFFNNKIVVFSFYKFFKLLP